MSALKNLNAFRQLSLNCDVNPERKCLRRQFSEDIPDESGLGIKISLSAKTKSFINPPPPIKIAWEDTTTEIRTDDSVIIRKCQENRRSGKLSRQSSVDKESILHSRQEIVDRLMQKNATIEVPDKPKLQEDKPNLKIFLAHNRKQLETREEQPTEPKIMPPLFTHTGSFHIKKNHRLKPGGESPRTNPIPSHLESNLELKDLEEPPQPIDVTIRPTTATSRRERFQKRTNSAFHQTIKEPNSSRPVLVRSSSAPLRPDQGKSKFVATKRKIRPARKFPVPKEAPLVKEVPKSQRELNRTTAINGNEVVTMVSLVSPAGSDLEEELTEQKGKEKCKTAVKKEEHAEKSEKEVHKIMSLRKAVKTVSFQQSTIHAIRSFSASFPARRQSVATVLMLGQNVGAKAGPVSSKTPAQERRTTNATALDDDEDERGPKRRLVRDNTEEADESEDFSHEKRSTCFNVDFKTRTENATSTAIERPENSGDTKEEKNEAEKALDEQDECDSPKERQCLKVYRKMTAKGINVSFDTILRGMLTPTEYRLSKKKMEATQNETHEVESKSEEDKNLR